MDDEDVSEREGEEKNRPSAPIGQCHCHPRNPHPTEREPDLAGLKGASRKRKISAEEVATHKTEEDAWTVFKGKVYNLTPYLDFHPGAGVSFLRSRLS